MDIFLGNGNVNVKQEKLTPEDFDFGKYLGEGGYGKVYHARKRTGRDSGTICAMKVMRKSNIVRSKKKIENVRSERSILAVIKHPFIINLLYAFETEDSFFLGLEYMHGGDLFNYLEQVHILPEERARIYVAEVVLAVKYLHENSIVYRDLKPDNILLDTEGHIKLSDFGLCKRLCPEKCRSYTFCGTLDYMSPEMVQKRIYNNAVDWWSTGVLLYDMLNGCPPFTITNDRNMTMQNIRFGKFSFQKSSVFVSADAKDLICKLLKIQPAERLGSGPSGAMEIMSHSFFNNINWENLLARNFEPLTERINDHIGREETFEELIEHARELTALAESDKNIFEDFDYVAPNLLSDALVTNVHASQDHKTKDFTHMHNNNSIILIDQPLCNVKF